MLSDFRPQETSIRQFIINEAATTKQLNDRFDAVIKKMDDALKKIKTLEKEYEANQMIRALHIPGLDCRESSRLIPLGAHNKKPHLRISRALI